MQMPNPAAPDSGFNPYAAGDKHYGLSGRTAATSGPVSAQGQQGYDERDTKQKARRQAVLQRMQAAQNGNYMSADYLRGVK
jgi:hypothetical protein